jgi:hypothetical protein
MANKKKPSRAEIHRQIHALRGSLKFNTGGKSFAEWMADCNREEKELEEAKLRRMGRI